VGKRVLRRRELCFAERGFLRLQGDDEDRKQ
jgi:hypothetical protein